jgi:hypothetical protein
MLTKDSFLLRTKYSIKNPLANIPFFGQLPGGKKKNKKMLDIEILQTHFKKKDRWSLKGKQASLFRKGSLWAFSMEGGVALANDRKESPEWANKILPDGVLLTKALKALLPQSKWESLGSETFDDRPVLVWRCRLEGKPARLLHATRMTQTSNSFGLQMMLFLNLPGMKKRKSLDLHVEVTLYEDPGHKLPIRATIRTFLPRKMANGPGGVIIQIQGNQGPKDEETDKEKPWVAGETKSHKLVSNIEFLFSRWGRVKPQPLPQGVEKLLR